MVNIMQTPFWQKLSALIEQHERDWGDETYTWRPKLGAILHAPVIVFWEASDSAERRLMITLHSDLCDLEQYVTCLMFHNPADHVKKRIVHIFKAGKPVIVREVKVSFQEMGN